MERPQWAPDEVDITRPSVARVYDYYLGGSHNFPADREMAEEVIRNMPGLPGILRANRAFLRLAVRYLAKTGVTQFLDLGSGIPTVGNVHEEAKAANPDARIVYVDLDPVAVAHSRAIVNDIDGVEVVQADMRRANDVLTDPRLTSVLDLNQPIAVLMVAVLHFVPDSDDPGGIIGSYKKVMAPGSYIAVTHAIDDVDPDEAAEVKRLYERTPSPMTFRSASQLDTMLSGFELLDPLTSWWPKSDDAEDHIDGYAGYYVVGHLA